MKKEIKNLVEKFKVSKEKKSIEPYYLISYTMDSNDGDYMNDTCSIPESEWKSLHPVFFLALLYLGNGYDGKFSHGNNWGDYYGHHFEDNKHGLSELADILDDDIDIMCRTDWGKCHSYVDISIDYYDEQEKKHSVNYPSIDDLFETEEEMIATITEAIEDYYNSEEDGNGLLS